ncbi:MAG: hypothetical protein BWY47_00589 [Bacteroidetes bacterium ADurb.Bin302]|nr:MAG: hypothetical protein BWY47_00589 [Bacteroidetes bacterium ADurb.Bin302]
MLLSKTVILKWNSKIKKHYESLGYTYTKMKDEFEVNVSDLTRGSAVIVDVECDYCHTKYQKEWNHYLTENRNSYIHKDCCGKCKKYKCQESNMDKYGVKSVLSLSEIKNKIASTNLEKYGVENPFSNEEIKAKIKETNFEKYGCNSYTQTEEYKQRVVKTCIAKYGVPYFVMTQRFVGEDSHVGKVESNITGLKERHMNIGIGERVCSTEISMRVNVVEIKAIKGILSNLRFITFITGKIT